MVLDYNLDLCRNQELLLNARTLDKNSKYETLHIFFKVLATKNIVVHCS